MARRLLHLSNDLALPLDFITRRWSVYGDSGAGKSTLARLICEKVHEAGQRFGVVDLKNDFFGLKSSADGKSAGLPVVIFGGPRADVKLVLPEHAMEQRGGGGLTREFVAAVHVIADTIAAIDQSFIIDLDDLSRTKQEQFLAAFLERLYDVNRRPLMMIMDEADRYAPQKPMTPAAIMSLSASEDICRRGRKRGIGSGWITQRTSVINKNVDQLANNLVAIFRTPGGRDLKELQDRVGRICDNKTTDAVLEAAPGLEDGQAFFLSSHPALREYLPNPPRPLQLPMPSTFDSSATPGVGQRRREPKVLAKADLAAIETKMVTQVERAKAEDPKALRAELAETKKLLTKTNAMLADEQAKRKPAAKVELKPVKVPVVRPADVKRIHTAMMTCSKAIDRMHTLSEAGTIRKAYQAVVSIQGRLEKIANQPPEPIQTVPVHPATATSRPSVAPSGQVAGARTVNAGRRNRAPLPRVREAAATNNNVAVDGDLKINGTQQRILDALAYWESMFVKSPSGAQLGAVANIDTSGGHFSNVIGPLSTAGLVNRTTRSGTLTDAGRALARAPDKKPTLESHHADLRARVRRTRRASSRTVDILDVLIAAGGKAMTTAEIGASIGMDHTGGHFSNTIGPLGTLGLIERGDGVATPTVLMFPEGLQ